MSAQNHSVSAAAAPGSKAAHPKLAALASGGGSFAFGALVNNGMGGEEDYGQDGDDESAGEVKPGWMRRRSGKHDSSSPFQPHQGTQPVSKGASSSSDVSRGVVQLHNQGVSRSSNNNSGEKAAAAPVTQGEPADHALKQGEAERAREQSTGGHEGSKAVSFKQPHPLDQSGAVNSGAKAEWKGAENGVGRGKGVAGLAPRAVKGTDHDTVSASDGEVLIGLSDDSEADAGQGYPYPAVRDACVCAVCVSVC